MVVALRAPYEADTLVIDIDADEDIPMQIHGDDGYWHRPAIGEATFACGQPIPRGAARRHGTYDGVLCRAGCFSSFELAAGERNSNGGTDR